MSHRSVVLLALFAGGCSVHGVHVAGLEVPTPAPVVERADQLLYVVVADIPETPIAGQRGPTLHQLRNFARRPLKEALSTYFETVIVVDSVDHVPSVPHLELHVTVDEIGSRPVEIKPWDKMLARSVPTLTWGAQLQGVDMEAPEFSYLGTVEGAKPMSFLTSAEPAVEQLLGEALVDFTTELVVTGTVRTLRTPPAPEPEPIPVPECLVGEDAVSATM